MRSPGSPPGETRGKAMKKGRGMFQSAEGSIAPPRVRRRQKTAHVAVRKDTMLMQTDDGPRVVWAVTKPKVKKR